MRSLRPEIPRARAESVRGAIQAARVALGTASPDLVLVNDPQRATASPEILAEALGTFDFCAARVLVATGSHRFTPEQRRKFQRLFDGVTFAAWDWHDARRADLAGIGEREGWRAHPWLAQARHVLAVGSVEPHYFAGFTGAHKTLAIGCADLAGITRNHAGAMDPACRPCRLAGTPVHAGIMRMLDGLARGRALAVVNVMQAGSTIIEATGGAPKDALAALVPKVESAYLRCIAEPAIALVVEVTGALACSFYQAEKGIKNSEWAVRDRGVMVLVAGCPEGIGQDAFVDLLRAAPTHATAVDLVRRRGYQLGDHKAVRLRYLTDAATRGVRVFVVSGGLSDDDAALLGVRKVASVEAALRLAGVRSDDKHVYHVEDAGNTCVVAGVTL